ncbi:MAG TPA: cysteine--tRNA ligase [Patescibacteria group bacterium]|nr:cysteine--tRNA ligase [Patescibacteria group bacterium]
MKIYNTLSRSIEEFIPQNPPQVSMYSCGPTVYDYQHIGHMRRYVGDDVLIRVLQSNGYTVHHVMNITDVGHLVSDSDTGEDKMEKGSKKFGKSVWEVAKMFENQFKDSCRLLNIVLPHGDNLMHATDYIKEQIELVETLEEKGYTYKLEDGIYFDTSKFPDYFKLSRQNPEELKKGARVEFIEGKKNAADFALWKFSPKGEKRQMEWDSPWGIGFPGWHIECSAMSMKALGRTLDIHTGGIDHIAIHHTNEIAQSECATGVQFVRYWVHHNFLVVNGTKMSKSLGNFYTVEDVKAKGYDPLSLRYLYLQTHYRQEMNFTWEALEGAQKAYKKLVEEIASWDAPAVGCAEYEERFMTAVNDDMNMSKALSIVWELVKSDYPTSAKAESMKRFDEILGLQLFEKAKEKEKAVEVPEEVQKLLAERETFRKSEDWVASDELRKKIESLGFAVADSKEGSKVVRK